MRERGILFSGPMVRVLPPGPKTQTRRAIKLQTGETFDEHALVGALQEWRPVFDKVAGCNVGKRGALIRCPYGVPGDRLWVRETFYAYGRWITAYDAKKDRDAWHFIDMTVECGNWYFYDATSKPERVASFRRDSGVTPMWWKRPAIFMPRAASRTLLEVIQVRVQRLQDISTQDCWAEGIPSSPDVDPRHEYQDLWETINGAGSWDRNDWVWAVSFKVAPSEGPITQSDPA